MFSSKVVLTALCAMFLLPISARAQAPSNPARVEEISVQRDKLSPQPAASPSPLPFKIGNAASRAVQSLTGITPLTEFVVGQVAARVIHRRLGGKVKVRLKTWSFTDLLAGKIKYVNIGIKNCAWKGTRVGDVQLSSATPIWIRYRRQQAKRAGLRSPIFLTLKSNITEQDVAAALGTERIASSLRALKLDLPGLGAQQLQVLNPAVSMSEDLVKISGVLVTAGASAETGVPLTVSGKVELQGNDKIVLKDMGVDSAEILEPQKFSAFLEQLLNPLVNLQRFDRRDLAVRLNTLKVSDGLVQTEGRVVLAPRADGGEISQVAAK